jgi:nicotinamide-nucleotide amidase
MPNIKLVVIGNEILNGKIFDKNIYWLARFLNRNNLQLNQSIVAHDNYSELEKIFRQTIDETDIFITSGGLGPTKDDITKDFYENFFGLPIEKSEEAYAIVEENYKRKGMDFSTKETANCYPFLPKGVMPFNNPLGLAPGLGYKFDHRGKRKILLSAPGVPWELSAMVEEEFYPFIKKELSLNSSFTDRVNIRTKLIPEEKIFTTIAPNLWSQLEQLGQVSSLPQIIGIDITVSIEGKNQNEMNQKRTEIIKIVKDTPLKGAIWQIGETPLNEFIVQKAKEKKFTISTAESCTGGLIASLLTDISGSSEIFLGTAVTYSNSSKENIINVQNDTLEKFGAVSIETAKEMAEGTRKVFGSDIGISTTGIAGPLGGSKEKPVGTVCIGISDHNNTEAKLYNFSGERTALKTLFARMALYTLLDKIS